ncbi:MAG: ABC transporter substrate-binding protein [Thermodesulfobacteriota bacterium]
MKKRIILATGHAHAFHRASVLAAIGNGYFLAEGMQKVEVRATGDDDLTVERLKSGDIDFGLDPRPHSLLEENAKGEKLYIIAGMLNFLDFTLISTPDVKSIADLKGRKIGLIEKGHGRDATWIRMLLRKEGIDPDKDVISVLDVGYGSLEIQGPRLDRGDYQAVFLSGHYKRPELFEKVRKAGYNVLAERSETHPEGLPDRVVATTGKMLAQYPEIVKGVLKGVVRGYRFARDPKNAEKLRDMYLAQDWGKKGFGWGKFDDKLFDGMISSARILPPDGSISLTGLEDVIAEWKASRKLPDNFKRNQVLRLEILGEAVKELNTKYGPEGYE